VVVATALGVWSVLHKGASTPIAVLPLLNLSRDSANDYLADGLTAMSLITPMAQKTKRMKMQSTMGGAFRIKRSRCENVIFIPRAAEESGTRNAAAVKRENCFPEALAAGSS
jgi:hypothetical protein